MVMNDDTWYVVRNTRGVTGSVGPGSVVPIYRWRNAFSWNQNEKLIDFKERDMIAVIGGVYRCTAGVVKRIDENRRTVKLMLTCLVEKLL